MPALLLDRRLQTCTDAELQALHVKLARVINRFGSFDLDKCPRVVREQFVALQGEYARRGCQLRLV